MHFEDHLIFTKLQTNIAQDTKKYSDDTRRTVVLTILYL